MNLADIAIRRPIFISAVVLMILVLGLMSIKKLPVDLFPNVTFPVVVVTTVYRGAGPAEVEQLISKPMENELSTISGLKRLTSYSAESVGTVVAEFTLETDIRSAESRIRDGVTAAKKKLPKEIDEPVIRRIDPADQPVLKVSLDADLPPGELYDLANEVIRPRLEQVPSVGLVEVTGGRKREIQVQLEREKLKGHELSAMQVASRIGSAGENIPLGKTTGGGKDTVYRSLGQYEKVGDIGDIILNFFGNDIPVTVRDVGAVVDTLGEEVSRNYVNGKPSLFLNAFRQSGSNTVFVVDKLKQKIEKLNEELKKQKGTPKLQVVRDGAVWIRSNVTDVKESIFIGVGLAIFVVFLFLANGRSTFITAMALPNSLIGAFILMSYAGFSINIMTLLALSLSVGLLIDDAIVVRENIFRHMELGKPALQAALEGTAEVRLAVIATTCTVIAVFGPVAFLSGVVGQFFKEFGLTICFAMTISLFDALTMAPMLSAYLAKTEVDREGWWGRLVQPGLDSFDRFQRRLEAAYERLLHRVLKHPIVSLLIITGIFIFSLVLAVFVPKTFLPPQDAGEFTVAIDLMPGTSLDAMDQLAMKVDEVIRKNPEVELSAMTAGKEGDTAVAEAYVKLVPRAKRSYNTSEFKDILRNQLKEYSFANPKVKDFDAMGGGQRPFMLNFSGQDNKILEVYGLKILDRLKNYADLRDVDINFRPGKPEFQIHMNPAQGQTLGISNSLMAGELRAQVDGVVAGKFRENGLEYDVRVRLKDEERNLKQSFQKSYIPNINGSLVPLSRLATGVDSEGPNKISRQDRGRMVQIAADLRSGAGLGNIMKEISDIVEKEIPLPSGVTYSFIGQAENFKELGESMGIAMSLGILFIYFVLASLYESLITPFTIMIALPLAMCGSFIALFIARESMNIFSWIGMIMLLGVATKNSILLVDYANHLIQGGMERNKAVVEAGKTRLRPILMTTMALIAGTLPIAIGLNEASKQRTSMGIAIVGGLISSTLLTLVVVPAVFSYLDRFRLWARAKASALIS